MPEPKPVEAGAPARRVRLEPLMGTVITLDLRDAAVPTAAADSVFAWFHEVDAVFSTFRSDSEISRLSRGELSESQCRREVREVLGLCEEVRQLSGGSFDVRHGGTLDPSALVKGWSVERAAGLLTTAGARNFAINAGGDVLVRGEPVPGQPWRVGVRHPEVADRVAAVLGVRNLAVATSGAYERGRHIADPRRGGPASGPLSMTVVGPSLTYADAYATAAFVMGDDGAGWVGGIGGYEALAITARGTTVSTPGIAALIVP
ncbi:MAG: FAD:protein FMN transferase [Candidatus Dormibacteria bacterium]|jgi:thiamine biosynthesis lipoprotein